jgi:hypothetical protein
MRTTGDGEMIEQPTYFVGWCRLLASGNELL